MGIACNPSARTRMRLYVVRLQYVGSVVGDDFPQLRYRSSIPAAALRDGRHRQSCISGCGGNRALAGASPISHDRGLDCRQAGLGNYSKCPELNNVARRSGYGRTFNQCENPHRLSSHRILLNRNPTCLLIDAVPLQRYAEPILEAKLGRVA